MSKCVFFLNYISYQLKNHHHLIVDKILGAVIRIFTYFSCPEVGEILYLFVCVLMSYKKTEMVAYVDDLKLRGSNSLLFLTSSNLLCA